MPLKTQHDDQIHLNLTPMIDVLFTLILFFMVAAKFSELNHELEVDLPQVGEAGITTVERKSPRIILVQTDGQVRLDGRVLAIDELARQLKSVVGTDSESEVIIQGDKACPFQHIAATMAACREAGVVELGIDVQTASTALGGGMK